MAMREASASLKLEDVVREHYDILREINRLKEQVKNAGSDASRAHERIDTLEKRMDEIGVIINNISRDMTDVKAEVKSFGPRQELFLQNTWRLIFNLVMLFGGFIVILGGLVGIKIAFPILFGGQ
jgi:DNA repair ATPase RecN